MEDRVVGFNAVVPVTGYDVVFDPEFYVVPDVGIMVKDQQEGDVQNVTGETTAGFHIAFTNGGSAVERNITGIAKAYGSKEV
jgi:hypothetical protein